MKDRTKNSIKPFWSWNDKLEKAELERQIELMKQNGIEGFFMHARGGLRTEYLSQDWFDMIEACLDKADKLGMQAWAYDENGWPSGFADGLVPAKGVEYQQKFLKCSEYSGDDLPENIVACFECAENNFIRIDSPKKGCMIFYMEINPYYVDVFNIDATKDFINKTHQVYYERFGERFGTSLKGFFTDEPQYGNGMSEKTTWSCVFEEKFREMFGYELLDKLPCLFFEAEGYEAVRNDFYSMASKLFSTEFLKPIYDWCTEHNCKLTGHLTGEDSLDAQMRTCAGVMPAYEYFHEPGMDWLTRGIASPAIPKQLGSVAKQLGRKTLSETYALCGWDVSLNELKWMAQWQYLNGATSLCPHLEGYTIRGERKRDYPASLFVQLPWFHKVYEDFADYFTSLGAMLDEAREIAPLLMIHPMYSSYVLFDCDNSSDFAQYSKRFDEILYDLGDEHILHHYGDETILERHGSVNGAEIKIGLCSYTKVLLPNTINLTSNTVSVLLEFAENGGKIYGLDTLPKYENGRRSDRIEKLNSYVEMLKSVSELAEREPEVSPVNIKSRGKTCYALHTALFNTPKGEKLLYITNNTKENISAQIELEGEYSLYLVDLLTEKEKKMSSCVKNGKTCFEFDFAEYASAIIIAKKYEGDYAEISQATEYLKLDNKFKIASCSDNAITLDKCTYRINGGEWQEELAVILLQAKALALREPCDVEMKFTFNIKEEFDFSTTKLCMEDPDKFRIKINGSDFDFEDCGEFVDSSIRKSNMGSYLKLGLNVINLSCRYTQSEELYYAKLTPGIHESVLNKLTYDTELESIYVIGDFGVEMAEDYTLGERKCLHGGKTFSLVAPKTEVDITDITRQNYWFFSGMMSLSQKVETQKSEDTQYKIKFNRLNAPAAEIYVNGVRAGVMAFAPYELDVTDLIKNGENEITVSMLSGNRNLLGPHHKPMGESYSVGPSTFTDTCGWTDNPDEPQWTDNYNFVLFGAEM